MSKAASHCWNEQDWPTEGLNQGVMSLSRALLSCPLSTDLPTAHADHTLLRAFSKAYQGIHETIGKAPPPLVQQPLPGLNHLSTGSTLQTSADI
jgi:hypothetical protein